MAQTDASNGTIQTTRAQLRFASWMTDVLVYTVVLNLFVEYSEAIVIDSFTISLLTAVLLKLLLDVIKGIEHRVLRFFQQKEGTLYTVLGGLSVFGILFLSKFAILEIVDIVFGDHVDLGHFIDIIALIVTMIVARRLVDLAWDRLGPAPEPEEA
jgi:hypothetical protein